MDRSRVCVSVVSSPSGAFLSARTPALSPLLAFMGPDGVTPMPSQLTPTTLISIIGEKLSVFRNVAQPGE